MFKHILFFLNFQMSTFEELVEEVVPKIFI